MQVRVGGRRIMLQRVGTGEPLVCLPGGPGFPGGQLEDLGGLAVHRTLLLPDWRGAGDSDPPDDGRHGIGDYAADLPGLLAALDLQEVDLFGHSFGGLVAATFAATHPDRVRRLVLDGTPDRAGDGRAPQGEGLAGFFAHYDETARAYAEATLPTIFQPALDWFGEHEYATFDLAGTLQEIEAPTLVLTGDSDWACGPERAAAMVDLLPAGELAVIADAGHFAWVEQPAAYVRAVTEFLDAERRGSRSAS